MRCDAVERLAARSAWRLGSIVGLAAAMVGCARESGAPSVALTIFPPQPIVQVGGIIQLRADPAHGPLQWGSSDTTIVSVARGLAQGITSGTAMVTATDGIDSGAIAITVTPANTVPSLATDIQQIFTNYCVSCHQPPAPQENILLTDGPTSYANLVNQPSPSTLKTLVVPFDTTNSYMYDMIRGRASNSADNMPQGCTTSGLSPCLPPALIHLMAAWILSGAKP
jgi:hypothetical protein